MAVDDYTLVRRVNVFPGKRWDCYAESRCSRRERWTFGPDNLWSSFVVENLGGSSVRADKLPNGWLLVRLDAETPVPVCSQACADRVLSDFKRATEV